MAACRASSSSTAATIARQLSGRHRTQFNRFLQDPSASASTSSVAFVPTSSSYAAFQSRCLSCRASTSAGFETSTRKIGTSQSLIHQARAESPVSSPPTLSLRTYTTSKRRLQQSSPKDIGRSESRQQSALLKRKETSTEDEPYRPPEASETSTVSDNPSKDKIPKKPSEVSLSEIRRLFTLARPEKRTLYIALGLLAVSSAVSLSVPFTLGRIIDLFTSSDSSSLPVSVPVAAALLAAFFGIGAAANTGRSILMRIAGQRIVKDLRINAYNKTLRLDMAKYDMMGTNVTPLGDVASSKPAGSIENAEQKEIANASTEDMTKEQGVVAEDKTAKETQGSISRARSSLSSALSLSTTETTPDTGVRGVGDIISRLGSDSSIVGESLTRELSEGLRALATVVVGVGMMVYISAKLTVVMLCIVPPSAIGAVFYGRYLKKLSRRTQKKVGEMIAVAEERLSSVRTVQAFNAVEPTETNRYAKKANDILDLAKKEAYASGLFYGGAGFSGNITMLALLSYGGKLVSTGEITVGDLSSLMLYTAYVGGSLVGLTSFFSTIMKGLGAAARVFELLDATPASVQLGKGIRLPADAPPRSLSFKNVHFNYPSRPDAPILRGLDFTIERGRSVAVAGGSGSGKSTIVNLLVRYYDPASGSVQYGDEDIREFTPESWRDRVSIVPQDPALFSQTVAENIAYGKPNATMSEIREAARLANCNFIDDLPLGFDTPVGAKAAQLSGGQRQRLAIARALVRQPSILILDEATSALDAQSETLVNNAVKKITSTRSLTTILVAHRLSTLKTADEIIYMQDGRVAERGTYEQLAREGTLFWEMVRSQMLGTVPSAMPTASLEQKEQSKKEEEEAQKSSY